MEISLIIVGVVALFAINLYLARLGAAQQNRGGGARSLGNFLVALSALLAVSLVLYFVFRR